MHDLWRTIKYASKFKLSSFLNFLLTFISAGLGLVSPVIYKYFFDLVETTLKTGATSNTYRLFALYSFYYLIFSIVNIFINRWSMYQWVKWSNQTERALNVETFDHVQNLSLEFFSSNQTGKIIERISKGIGDAISVVQSVLFQFAPQFIIFIITTVVLFKINWIFGLIVGLGIPIYIAITLAFNKAIIKIHDDIRADYEKIGAVRTESIMNIQTVKSYVQEGYQLRKFTKLMDKKVADNMQWAKTANYMFALRGITYYGSLFLSITLGIYYVLNGSITLGTFILVWSYINKAYDPMQWIMRIYDETLRQMRSVRRLFKTLDTLPTVQDEHNAENIRVKTASINIQNVYFNYDDDKTKKILRGVSLDIKPKQTVAVVGKSGSGKTTLTKLLMRFYDPTKGVIYFDGKDISKVTQSSLRKNISYVLQDSILFNDTVANNIKFGKPKATLNEIKQAAKVANADDFIEKLPKKYQTIVGERGVKLSGGEQQRINIARAVLNDSPILILDEATSSLDSESELIIQDALEKLIKDKTTIIIAHRLATVMRADLIVVMDKGKITEIGTHGDLVKQKGIYAKLFEIQSGGYLK